MDAVVAEVLVSTPAQSVAGGADEIERLIRGGIILGLAKDERWIEALRTERW